MLALALTMMVVGFAVGLPATWAARGLGRRLSALDGAGVAGQIKAPARRVPNTGGVGIFLGVLVPIGLGLIAVRLGWADDFFRRFLPNAEAYVPGMVRQTPLAIAMLAGMTVLHVVGLIDDRRPLGAGVKMIVMLGVAVAVVVVTDSRLLTLLDARVGGPWLSITLTALWIVVVMNAFNFLDNMDGLAGGVGLITCLFFLASSLFGSGEGQWFVGASLAVMAGAIAAFLMFNFPWRRRVGNTGGASVFMGDGGSLVMGFLLAFLSVRITYVHGAGKWHGLLTPLIILAIPLYDFVSVTLIRLAQGKSPFVGDLQHFSHRLVQRGLSPRRAVVLIYGCTLITAIGAVAMPRLQAWQAVLVGVQTLLVLGFLGFYEWSRSGDRGDRA